MLTFAVYETPIGCFKIMQDGETIVGIQPFCDDTAAAQDYGTKTALTDTVFAQLIEYAHGTRTTFAFPYTLHGTSFQQRVWNALCDIPYGETRSYRDIAAAIGNPKACRAVGMANNKNPMMIVVPCHRVIGSNGTLTGYAGGLMRKKQLLELECSHKNP